MPSNVAWFERLMYGALLLRIVSGYLSCKGSLQRQPRSWPEPQRRAAWHHCGAPHCLLPIWALFIWLAARRRKGWARYVLAALFLVGLLPIFWAMAKSSIALRRRSDWMQLLISLSRSLLAFTGNARAWFARPAPQH